MPKVRGEVMRTDSRNEIYSFLRNQILSLAIELGEMLSEDSPSSQMSISRALVRDALARLIEEDHVVVYPQRGAVIVITDPERIERSVRTHIILEQAVIEEICRQELTSGQRETLEQTLTKQREIIRGNEALEFLAADGHLRYLLSTFYSKEHIWDYFRTMDYDLMWINYLQYSTSNSKAYTSSLTRREHTQVERRLLIDDIVREDAEATSLICFSHFNAIL